MCETSNLILICQKLGLFGPIKQKAKLPLLKYDKNDDSTFTF